MTISDEEISQRIIKNLNDIKIARRAIRKIYEKTDLDYGKPTQEEYTIISKNELAHFKHIEQLLYEIHRYSKEIYSQLRGKDDGK